MPDAVIVVDRTAWLAMSLLVKLSLLLFIAFFWVACSPTPRHEDRAGSHGGLSGRRHGVVFRRVPVTDHRVTAGASGAGIRARTAISGHFRRDPGNSKRIEALRAHAGNSGGPGGPP